MIRAMAEQTDAGLQKAIDHFGTQADLARALDLTPQAVNGWKKVPFYHVLTLERLTGIPRQELRPDVYPPSEPAPPSEPPEQEQPQEAEKSQLLAAKT